VLAMPVGRFLVLLEAARRRAANLRLWATQIAAFPWMEGADRQKMVAALLEQAETQEEREARWDAGWRRLDGVLSGAQIGTVRRLES